MKKTSELREFFRDLRASLAAVAREKPSMLPVTVANALLESAFPFVNIIFGAKILDCLLAGGAGVMTLVYWMAGLDLALGLGSGLLKRYCEAVLRTADNMTDMAVLRKCLTMDYQQLEDQKIMDKRVRAVEGSRVSGGGGGAMGFLVDFSSALGHGFTVLYALATLSVLFLPGTLPADASGWVRALNSPWAALGMLVLALGATLLCVPLNAMANRADMEMFAGGIDGNRRFSAFLGAAECQLGKDIRTYGMSGMVLEKYRRHQSAHNDGFTKFYTRSCNLRALTSVVNLATVLLAYAFVGLKAMAGLVSVGSLSMQVGAITAFAGAVSQGIEMVSHLDLHRKYMRELADFLATPSEKYDGTLPVEKRDDGEYALEFRDVGFRYPNQTQWSLRHVSVRLPLKGNLAAVGPNGAGKTTFIKLLCRLYDPEEGEILLNGIDIRKYDYGEYLSLLSVVFQDFRLFAMELGQNVAAAREYDGRRVWECLEKAGVRERAERMEQGLRTPLYQQKDGGVEISGGEAQKLALARALYKDAPVVILDEPTAALDPVSEFEIYRRFGALTEGKSSVYISHRMSSCRFCGEILVFDGGEMVQRGTHETLLDQPDGLYARLWHAQAQHYGEKEEGFL